MKLLGIQIANGYSPEVATFARLLSGREGAYDALILQHDWRGDPDSADRFARTAAVRLRRFDAGWRPNPDATRSRAAKAGSLAKAALTFPAMLNAARAYGPDLIYSNGQRWDLYIATQIARRLGKPQVVHQHYTVGPWLGRHALDRLRTCDRVIGISDFVCRQLIESGTAPERVVRIHNPMEVAPPQPATTRPAIRAELGIPPDAAVIGMIARLHDLKGQRDLIDAFAMIAADNPRAWLLLAGTGPARATLEAQARGVTGGDRIRFAGHRSDVPRLLAAIDVFAHPSRHEPFGLAVAEAQAAGLPVVAYDEGGIPEVVLNNETGLLAAPADIAGLAACLQSLLGDPARAMSMGEAGRARVAREFDPRRLGRDFAAVIRATPARPRPALA